MTTATETTAHRAFAFANEQLAAGNSIVVSSMTKSWMISPKVEASWNALGLPAFRMSGTTLEMRTGRDPRKVRYVTLATGDTLLVRIAAR